MNVLFIKPLWSYPGNGLYFTYNRKWPPLSLLNCAGIMRSKGHNTKIIDMHAKRFTPIDIQTQVQWADKVFITTSSLDRWICPNIDIHECISQINAITDLNKEVYLMGYHGTVAPEKMFELLNVKAIILGPPETVIKNIAEEKEQIDFLIYRSSMLLPIEINNDLQIEDISLPAWDMIDFNDYCYELLGNRFALIECSRGCSFPCKFCSKIMFGKNYVRKSIDQVKAEITELVEKYHVKNMYLIDLIFTYDRSFVEEICNFIIEKKYKLNWSCQTRIDSLDDELLQLLKRAGCGLIHLGVESGNKATLAAINKKIDFEKTQEILKKMKKYHIQSVVFFILGFEGEEQSQRNETFSLAQKLRPSYLVYRVYCDFEQMFLDYSQENLNSFIEKNSQLQKVISKQLKSYYYSPNYFMKWFNNTTVAQKYLQGKLFLDLKKGF